MEIIPMLTNLNKTSVRISLLTILTDPMVHIIAFSEIEQKDLVFFLARVIPQIKTSLVMKSQTLYFHTLSSTTRYKEAVILYMATTIKEQLILSELVH
jgi:hypothetical protein